MQAARPNLFRALMIVVSGAALALISVTAVRLLSVPLSGHVIVVAFGAMGLAALLDVRPVLLNEGTRVSLSVVPLFVGIAYGGILPALLIGLEIGVIAGLTARTDRGVKTVYNVGMHVLVNGVSAMAFGAVTATDVWAPEPTAALAEPVWLTVGLLVAGAAYTLVNAFLMGAILNVAGGVPFVRTARRLVAQLMVLQFVYVGLAAIAYVLLARVGAWALLLVAVPLLVARKSLLSVQERQEAFDRMVRAFVKAIELKDGYTRGHAERVSDLSVLVAERMGLSYEDRQLIRYGAILHDVGKIGVSLGILCKAGPLDDDEFAEMKTHPEVGAAMLADIDFLKPALAVVHHHHERMDGRGYPAGLVGDEIPLLTRVVTAVDAFDAMTSTRSYRRALPIHVALDELQANAGTQFDTTVVTHLVAVIAEHGWEITDEPVAVAAADSSQTSMAMP